MLAVARPSVRTASRRGVRQLAESASARAQPAPASVDLLALYRAEIESGRLAWDDQQVRVVMGLRHVHRRLSAYTPSAHLVQTLPASPVVPNPPRSKLSFWPFRAGRPSSADLEGTELVRIQSLEDEIKQLPAPQGLVLTGPPGTGKTRLVQLLFDALPTERKAKRHYHSFLLQIYHLLHVEGQRTTQGVYGAVVAPGKEKDYSGWRREDELCFKVAKQLITEEGWLIFFDELQLTDIATASVVQGVLLHFWRLGGVLLSTSNRLPSDLYGGGVQKRRIESFLSCLKGRCEVLELDGGRDWRHRDGRLGLESGGSWRVGDDAGSGRQAWAASWAQTVGAQPVTSQTLTIYNRPLTILRQTGSADDPPSTRAACFTFAELCENALGAADFLSICSAYGAIYISDVPALTLTKKNEARRLINLIDAMYEHRIHLHVLSDVPLDKLFFPEAADGATLSESLEEEALSEMLKEVDEPTRPNVSVYELRDEQQGKAPRPRSTATKDFRSLSIYSGEDERFAFKRALSRLQELTNPALARAPHEPLPAAMRTWETARSPTTARTMTGQAQAARDLPPSAALRAPVDDFADEAAFASPLGRGGGPRAQATKLRSEAHFWGLADAALPRKG